MALWLVLTILFVSFVVLWLKFQQNYWLRRGIPHKPPTFPYGNLGNSHWTKAYLEFYKKFKGTGPYCGFYMFLTRVALILDLDLVKNILIKDFNNFEDRGIYHNERDDPLMGNLFFLDSEKWHRLRNKMSPTFTSGKMKHMFTSVVKVGEEFQNVMLEKVDNGPKSLEITNLMGRFTADVIGVCAFGLDCNSLRNPEAEFVKMGKMFFTEPRHSRIVEGLMHAYPNIARFFHMRTINQPVHEFYMNIVRETIKYRERTGVKRNDFMDILLELKNPQIDESGTEIGGFTVEEIAAQAFVFFIAGFETSSTTISFALYELAQNQDIQDKARNEILATLKKHNNELTYECMKEMEYLNQVISETLRKHPVVPHLIRKTKKHYETAIERYYIDAGTTILIPVIAIHNDPEYYPEPEKFKPERFTPEEIFHRHSCAYLPFGEGPRNCIGLRFGKMQTCVGLTYLLKNFRFSVAPETEIPYRPVKDNILVSPENGITLRVEKI